MADHRGAGFIGPSLLETLRKLDQQVVGLDNFATGHQRNPDEVKTLSTPKQWANFQFSKGDIRATPQLGRLPPDHVLYSLSLAGEGRSEGVDRWPDQKRVGVYQWDWRDQP